MPPIDTDQFPFYVDFDGAYYFFAGTNADARAAAFIAQHPGAVRVDRGERSAAFIAALQGLIVEM